MAESKSIFYAITQALRGNKKNIMSDLTQTKSLLINPKEAQNIEKIQQDYLDTQSLKIAMDLYSRSFYYDSDRITAYNDFRAMDQSPEIAVAMDILSDECVSLSDKGELLTIFCENQRIKKILTQLFNNTLNIRYNLRWWIRDLLKYGDNILKLEIDRKIGIYDIRKLPTGGVQIREGIDGNMDKRIYTWANGNNMNFEDWQIAHFSLLSDAEHVPYGTSLLEPARKLWKQLQLAQDAMLVYRLVRAPERRVFFIEVGNSNPADVEQLMDMAKTRIKKNGVVDQRSGTINLKYNPMQFEEDFWIPVRNGSSSKIETLPGASNLSDIEDINYLQNKLFTAIRVPKAYLNYVESLPGGSTLSQADLRFSRTVNWIQQCVIMELRRIANIHLAILGFNEEINQFDLTLTNPSTQQELLKLETMKARLDVFKEMFSRDASSPVSYTYAMQNILGIPMSDIKLILRQKKFEGRMFYEIERASAEYKDTGVFKKMDDKFRIPGFDPNAQIDVNGDGSESGGGGGGGGFGGGSSFGGLDIGGGEGMSGEGEFDAGNESPQGAELTGDEAETSEIPETEPQDNLKEFNLPSGIKELIADDVKEEDAPKNNTGNILLEQNKKFSYKTKMLMENIQKNIDKLNNEKNS